MLTDNIKQTSVQQLQGELDSHMETLRGQVRDQQMQQALSLHKVDMEASVIEVSNEEFTDLLKDYSIRQLHVVFDTLTVGGSRLHVLWQLWL